MNPRTLTPSDAEIAFDCACSSPRLDLLQRRGEGTWEAPDGLRIRVWREGDRVRVDADPPDLRQALQLLGFPRSDFDFGTPRCTRPDATRHRVMREDTNGNVFEIRTTTTTYEAERWVATFTARGHHQRYWHEPM